MDTERRLQRGESRSNLAKFANFSQGICTRRPGVPGQGGNRQLLCLLVAKRRFPLGTELGLIFELAEHKAKPLLNINPTLVCHNHIPGLSSLQSVYG